MGVQTRNIFNAKQKKKTRTGDFMSRTKYYISIPSLFSKEMPVNMEHGYTTLFIVPSWEPHTVRCANKEKGIENHRHLLPSWEPHTVRCANKEKGIENHHHLLPS